MNIREACEDIMGEKLASSIIADMGINWCVVAAMSDPRNAKRPRACGVIRAWLADQRKISENVTLGSPVTRPNRVKEEQ
jgi:hypothetical protein